MTEVLKMQGIKKVYSNGIYANKNVNFCINQGEIHALAGENGAGKSTLMKILFGMEQADEGTIYINNQKVEIKSPSVAIKNGIGMVHQHFMLVPSLTVAENLIMGIEPKRFGFIDFNKAVRLTEEISQKYDLLIDPNAKVEDLSVGSKQKLEILKALARGAKILILDEPTAVLTPQETKELFRQLVLLKDNGHTIIFISHKLKEIKEICDRITIMRSGKNVGVYNVKDISAEDISKLMIGRDIVQRINHKQNTLGETILKVKDLDLQDGKGKYILNNISFSVRSGQILGIAGVEGNGQSELIELITGERKASNGIIEINNENVSNFNINKIRKTGTSHIPADRMTYGVAGEGTIEENLVSDKIRQADLNKGFMLNRKKIEAFVKDTIATYKIICDSPRQKVEMLSGGNIQKVVVARELTSSPKLLIANQPTRGIDVGAAEFIHKKILELRDKSSAILLISAELNEVIELSDSLIVMHGGEIVAYFENSHEIHEEELGFYMLGIKKQANEEIGRVFHE